jgi:hypothetical protein
MVTAVTLPATRAGTDVPVAGDVDVTVPPLARDLRLDFLRGMAMTVLVVDHLAWYRNESLSLWHLVALDRVGTVRAAEAFLIISGVVLGMVTRRRVDRGEWGSAARRMKDRAIQLYLVNVVIGLAFVLLRHAPGLDTTTFMPPEGYSSDSVRSIVADVLSLRDTPWHINVLGLYVAMLLLAIPASWLLMKGETRLVVGLSVVAYAINQADNDTLTDALFETAFPILTYQVLFIGGLALGYHRESIADLFRRRPGVKRAVLVAASAAALGFFLLALVNTHSWEGSVANRGRLDLIDADTFWGIYAGWFDRWTLGVGRIANIVALLIVGYAALTRWWRPLDRGFGWFFVPIGQASLYVFIVHVAFALITEQPGWLHDGRVLVNTVAHTAVLAAIWLLVRHRVGFRWIPR